MAPRPFAHHLSPAQAGSLLPPGNGQGRFLRPSTGHGPSDSDCIWAEVGGRASRRREEQEDGDGEDGATPAICLGSGRKAAEPRCSREGQADPRAGSRS